MKISAIIPCRSGSKGIRDKNIAQLGELPLMAYSILAAKKAELINDVFVTSDSNHYLDISHQYGDVKRILRPGNLASDSSTDLDYFRHAVEYCEENNIGLPELWVLLRPTTPFRDVKLINEAINKFISNQANFTSMRSAHEAPESPQKWFKLSKDKERFLPYINNMHIGETNLPRQQFESAYIPNGYIDIVKTDNIKKGILFGEKIMSYISPQCIEIDTKQDLTLARTVMMADKDAMLAGLMNEY